MLRSIVLGLLVVWAFEVGAIAAVALIGAMNLRSARGRPEATLHNDLPSYDLAQPAMADLVGSSRGNV